MPRDTARKQNAPDWAEPIRGVVPCGRCGCLDFFDGVITRALQERGVTAHGRAKLVGYRTSGAGGSVIDIAGGPLAESETTMTNSLIMRAKEYQYEGFPKSPYIENVGVRPDIDLDYQTKDNLINRGKTFVDSFTKIMVDNIKSGGK